MNIKEYYKNIKNQDDPVKFVLSKILIRTKATKLLTIKHNGYKIKFSETSEISRLIWIDKKYTLDAEEFVGDYLKENDVAIDIGANIGLVSFSSSRKVGTGGKIYSIEPQSTAYQNLLENIELNQFTNIIPINTALGDRDGKVSFSNLRSDTMNFIQDEDSEGSIVPITKLDNLGIDDSEISLIKIDVEGYEKFVLDGGRECIKKTLCIYFEAIEKLYNKYGYSCIDVFRMLEDNGFKIFRLIDKCIVPIKYDSVIEEPNLLAIRDIDDFLNRTNLKIKN